MSNTNKSIPQLLSQIISQFGYPYDSIPYQSFRGIYNKSKEGRKGYVCFAISFFQLIFHSENIINYLCMPNLTNNTEILLNKIISKLHSNSDYKAISIKNFLSNWDGWLSSDGLLVNDSEDISEFCQYLLYSCSENFQNLFSITLNEKSEFPPDSVYYPNYFLRLELSDHNIQKLIDNYTQKHQILQLPQNLLLYLPRIYGTKFFKNDISINSFIKVNNINYKFVGCSIFLGKHPKGHYITYIKFFDKYVQFDDDLVSNLFFYENCPSQNLIDIKKADDNLTKKAVFFQYIQYDDEIKEDDWLKCEELFTDEVSSMYYADPTITSNKLNQNNLMANTLNLINSKTTNKEQLNRMIKSRQKRPSRSSGLQSPSCNSPSRSSGLQSPSCNSPNRSTGLQSPSCNSPNRIVHNSDELIQFGNNTFVSEQTMSLILNSGDSDINENIDNSEDDSKALETNMNLTDISQSSNSIKSVPSIESLNHLLLQKDEIIIDDSKETNLFGKLEFNNENIPEDSEDRVKSSKFAKYRQIFKIVGKLLRKLNLSDQGQTNSEILLNKLEVEVATAKEIVEQGKKLYKIIKKHANEDKPSFENIKNDLNPIFEWYKQRFHIDPEKMQIKEFVIDESLANHSELANTDLQSIYLPDEFDIDKFLDESKYTDDDFVDEEEEEEEDIGWTSTDDDDACTDEITDSDGNVVDQDPGVSLVLNLTSAQRARYDVLNLSHTDAALRSILNDIEEYTEWKKNDFGCSKYDEDDNHCIAECYFWKDRVEILNIEEIIEIIREKMTQKKHKIEGLNITISQLKMQIERDIYTTFARNPNNENNIEAFAKNYLRETNVIETTPSNVIIYKMHKGIPINQNVMPLKTLQNKLYEFKSSSIKKKREKLEYHPELASHGGFRKENIKVTDETIKCLLTLMIDFPNLSARAITAYINSPFGTNFENPVDHRTIQRYMKSLDFTVKRSSFSPPNRNSIGLRIFRVAWAEIIEKVFKNDNVLIGYIDEAAITTNEGPKKGRSYIGITPVVNCPLSKAKVSVLSLVLPGFGVLYQFYDGSVNNKQYSQFLKDAVRFIRRIICNNETEIIFIEDNCPIHSTLEVEETVKDLKIALLPIVPYSPSLNGVVEGLFAYVKSSFIRTVDHTDEEEIKNIIKENWVEIINNNFDLEIARSLYLEWTLRMRQCKKGEPIFSNHVEEDKSIQIDFNHLQYISVDRIKS